MTSAQEPLNVSQSSGIHRDPVASALDVGPILAIPGEVITGLLLVGDDRCRCVDRQSAEQSLLVVR